MNNRLDYSFEEYSELMRKHHEEAEEMSKRLAVVPGYAMRAERMSKCETFTKGIYCPKCKTFHTVRASLCRDRLCPNCGWALSRRRAKAVLHAVEALAEETKIEVIHIVLTLKHDKESELGKQITDLMQGFRKLTRKRRFQEKTLGYIRSIEIKKGNQGFHPHIHILYIVDKEYFKKPITHAELCDMWADACGICYKPVVWIQKAYSNKSDPKALYSAIYECVKYAIKTNEWKEMQIDDLIKTAEAIHGRMLFKVNGKKVISLYMESMEAEKPEEEEPTPCKKCGSNRYIASINI